MHNRVVPLQRATRNRAGTHLTLRWNPNPAQSVVGAFALAILAGAALLLLPIATPEGAPPATPLEAIFTSTSAVCVTGLAVVDTATFWSPFGQVVILALIQVGGFGIMTFASLIGISLTRRMSLKQRLQAGAEARAIDFADAREVVTGVLKMSLAIEGVIAVVLALAFGIGHGASPGEAVWLGVFHAVSSFNNAGFALYSDNLVGFVGDPFVCLPICAAIVLGGLGFPVLVQVRKHGARVHSWTITTRIVLVATPVLLAGGTALIAVLEWHNPGTLGPLDWPAKLLAAFFQSVQTRTAGFNSIDIGAMDPASLLGMDALMFVGGGPGGTAGGIKVTTFFIMFFFIVAELRGHDGVNVLGKRIPRGVLRQAITVGLLAFGLVISSTVLLMLTQPFTLDQLVFEAFSAFGTVGLSTGITPKLDAPGQVVLILLMFIGRLGPLTLGAAFARARRPAFYDLPEERPIVG